MVLRKFYVGENMHGKEAHDRPPQLLLVAMLQMVFFCLAKYFFFDNAYST
jgi:hypothetical protein